MSINDDSDNTVTIAQRIKCPSHYIRMHVLFCLGIYSCNLKDRAFAITCASASFPVQVYTNTCVFHARLP